MRAGFHFHAAFLAPVILVLESCAWCCADDSEIAHQLGLADLAGYRAALSGKATADDAKADDPPARVAFRDLWNRPDRFRGRRVTIEGRVLRIFRQGPVGSFPPLAEVWVTAPAGDPFCVVFPQPVPPGEDSPKRGSPAQAARNQGNEVRANLMPALGRTVRFTGTFLKQVSYAAGDGARLAPLVVGEGPPVPVPPSESADSIPAWTDGARALIAPSDEGNDPGYARSRPYRSLSRWALGAALAAAAAALCVRWFLRFQPWRARRPHTGRSGASAAHLAPNHPLEFIEPPQRGQPTAPDS
jgi:hypothetical protein